VAGVQLQVDASLPDGSDVAGENQRLPAAVPGVRSDHQRGCRGPDWTVLAVGASRPSGAVAPSAAHPANPAVAATTAKIRHSMPSLPRFMIGSPAQ